MMRVHDDLLLDTNEENALKIWAFRKPPILIPNEIFQTEQQRDYLSFYQDLNDFSEIFCEDFGDYKALFTISQQELLALKQQHAIANISHLLLEAHRRTHLQQLVPANAATLALILHENTADFWLENNGKLLIMNQFTFDTAEDLLYFSINSILQNKLELADVTCLLSELTPHQPNYAALLQQYLPHFAAFTL